MARPLLRRWATRTLGGFEVRREDNTMSGDDRDSMTAETDHTRSDSAGGAGSLHGDMSTPMDAEIGQNAPRTAAAGEGMKHERSGQGSDEAGNLRAPDDDTLGTLTTGGTGGTTGTGVSGTAEGTFEGAGHHYGDPDTLRDDDRSDR
jgi:hypothetical protein